jgi:hypothetical protein
MKNTMILSVRQDVATKHILIDEENGKYTINLREFEKLCKLWCDSYAKLLGIEEEDTRTMLKLHIYRFSKLFEVNKGENDVSFIVTNEELMNIMGWMTRPVSGFEKSGWLLSEMPTVKLAA